MLSSLSSLSSVSSMLGMLGGARTASFRGASFYVEDHARKGGRRIAEYEYPDRDVPYTEDLGRAIRKFDITGFVLGDGYTTQRDALLAACEDKGDVGTLLHPAYGRQRVRCTSVNVREGSKDGLRYARIDMTFVEAGQEPGPAAQSDTGSLLDAAMRGVEKGLKYANMAMAAIRDPLGFIAGPGLSMLGGLGGALGLGFGGLPGLDLDKFSRALGLISQVSGMLDVATKLGPGLSGAFKCIPGALASLPLPDPGTSSRGGDSGPIDPGLLPWTDWTPDAWQPKGGTVWGGWPDAGADADASGGFTLPGKGDAGAVSVPALWSGSDDAFDAWAAPGADSDESLMSDIVAQAIIDQVRGHATLALVDVYAQAEWPSSTAAEAVRDTLVDVIDARAEAAADAGDDALYLSWVALQTAVVEDFTRRAKKAARLADYSIGAALPSLVLAHLLTGSAASADALVAQNTAAHPAFMPMAGKFLVTGND